ncbi:MAG: cyclic nucleotide-binding domain-containing protein, partial [Nitrospira sp.]
MVRIRTPFNLDLFLNKTDKDVTILPSPKNQILFSQGDTTDAVFYIQSGKVKVTVLSEHGKEAVVAILERGAFLGETCLVG